MKPIVYAAIFIMVLATGPALGVLPGDYTMTPRGK